MRVDERLRTESQHFVLDLLLEFELSALSPTRIRLGEIDLRAMLLVREPYTSY